MHSTRHSKLRVNYVVHRHDRLHKRNMLTQDIEHGCKQIIPQLFVINTQGEELQRTSSHKIDTTTASLYHSTNQTT